MLLEHILYSTACAILIGIFVERKFAYILPVWIIAASAWLPDVDYIVQTIMYEILLRHPQVTPYFIVHGDFHNVIMVFTLSVICASILNILKKINFRDAFICVLIGCIIHIICDYTVYMGEFCFISPRFYGSTIFGAGLIKETGSWHGILEPTIFAIGVLFLFISICIKFYYSDSMWIEDSTHNAEES